jgi:hypothetical protein
MLFRFPLNTKKKRIVEFVDATRLEVELVYYPPYHSKYNAMEHCWGVLDDIGMGRC